ncbi:unnamed protein product [Rotaria sp. Silwood1]|nr:unnamed protein product [Rotaria sp. Silwood1]CAF1611723.1 unnamed protein product [Rotaria sp. Silwood1]CAF3752746.1 unnamed protein product [Rotaria sp. Silwood1]CAF3762091.1 unnamed protein product [Rotaria sp. Silwood1]CAF4521326.1 unnamed protein product [Rotaria sp. Silwood1]
MTTSFNKLTLETLPDEILLQICKYLSCADILVSLTGLSYRITQMITQYRHHISLHKTSLSQSDYLCGNIFPQIGSQIRSLLIDCCYSVLQDDLFIKYFANKISITFPQLERISLVAYEDNQLIALLDSLHDLNHFVEIRLYSLYWISQAKQSTVVRSLFQANNHRLTTILMDDDSTYLHFQQNDSYLNIIRLRINLRTRTDLSSLFHAVPNVQYLDVIIHDNYDSSKDTFGQNLPSLLHLTNFELKSIMKPWTLEELLLLFAQLPIVKHLSLCLLTHDRRLVDGNTILPSLPSTVQLFHYATYFIHNMDVDSTDDILVSWSSSHPVVCFQEETLLFLHTLPWYFADFDFPDLINKKISCGTNYLNGYYSSVQRLMLQIDRNFTFTKALEIISQCHQVKKVIITITDIGEVSKEEQRPLPHIPKLSRLHTVSIHGPIPSDLSNFLFLFNVAPNLVRLDLPFEFLWQLIENQQIRHILGQHITSLFIHQNATSQSSIIFNEKHVPIIASTFFRVDVLSINLTHLPNSSIAISNDNIMEDSTEPNERIDECQQTNEVVSPDSIESMIICLLREFKEHKLIGLGISGNFCEKLKTDAKQWLQQNTILSDQRFEAVFNKQLHQLLIWI